LLDGRANPREMTSDLRFHSADTSSIKIPYIEERLGLKSNFKNIHFQLNNIDYSSKELHIKRVATINQFTINHPKIASK
ncbi:hypothetical protein ACKC5Q_23385, partial [Aeromonas dhakensis]|uniref:hypothetical protein n=1 Tax=Aeromonas dhakensis TaxID=196024 RepID=UPI0038B5B168